MADYSRDPVYVISIAAERVGLHPQTLRLYEKEGLLKPERRGANRLYSDWDIERVRHIRRLTQDMGVNLAGVEIILNLLEQLSQLQDDVDELRRLRMPVPVLEEDHYRR